MNDLSQNSADIGALPCPTWCTDHLGERGQNNGPIDEEALASTLKPIGHHRAVLYYYRRFDNHEPVAVHVDQMISLSGLWDPNISFWPGIPGLEPAPGDPPMVPRTFTANEARALGEALIQAATLFGELLPERCANCDEPIAENGVCRLCDMRQRAVEHQSARANLKAMN
jgi:hypothetical protein